MADPDYPTMFSGKEFISRTTFPRYRSGLSEKWGGVNSADQLYVMLSPLMDKKRVEVGINRLSQKNMPEEAKGYKRWHLLQPLGDIHFNSDYPSGGRIAHKPTLYGLVAIAVFLLLLACINYINLSIAQLPQRAREIGVLKSLGSSSLRLVFRFLGETLLILILALNLSGLLTRFFFSNYPDLVPENMDLYTNPWQILLFLVGLILLVSIVSGLYPGWMLARFEPVSMLRGGRALPSSGKHSRFTLSKSLIVFQFVIAQAFIIGALIAAQQLKYSLEKDMGFDKQAVLLMEVPFRLGDEEEHTARRLMLKQELEKLPGIARVSMGSPPASSSWFSDLVTYKSEKGRIERPVYQKYVDTGMLSLYGMRLLAGRNLRESDTVAECVVNETYLKQFGITSPEEAVGKYLASSDENKPPIPIVGVVADFHQLSFHHRIEPAALMASKEGLYTFNIKTFNIKLASNSSAGWEQAIKAIKNTWSRFYPGQAFEYKFYDEVIASFYKAEQRMARVINLSTGIAIIISCFGLFGLTTLTAVQRTKEIGIRKVLGASVASVLGLLSKDFIELILLAIAIASPIAWYAMARWLDNFAYRIKLEWWMFVLAGLLALIIALLTISFQAVKSGLMNPVRSLRSE